MPPVKVR